MSTTSDLSKAVTLTSSQVKIGLRGLPVGLATAVGAIFWTALLSTYGAHCKWVLFAAATMLTDLGGALSVMTPENIMTTIALGVCAGE